MLFLWIDLIFLQASLISAVFISCERFYAVYWPLKHLTLSTRAYAIVITLIWTLAFIVSAFFKLVRDFLPTKTGVYLMLILISIFLLVLCCCNISIWWKFQLRNNAPMNAIHQQNRARQARRLTKTLLDREGKNGQIRLLAELCRAKRVCGAPWAGKSTHPGKFGNHVTVHRPSARPLPVRLHHRATNVQSHNF